jgi:hypothetical protein
MPAASRKRQHNASNKQAAMQITSWDDAIREAHLRIEELKLAIAAFENLKAHGEPWPRSTTTPSRPSGRRRVIMIDAVGLKKKFGENPIAFVPPKQKSTT